MLMIISSNNCYMQDPMTRFSGNILPFLRIFIFLLKNPWFYRIKFLMGYLREAEQELGRVF